MVKVTLLVAVIRCIFTIRISIRFGSEAFARGTWQRCVATSCIPDVCENRQGLATCVDVKRRVGHPSWRRLHCHNVPCTIGSFINAGNRESTPSIHLQRLRRSGLGLEGEDCSRKLTKSETGLGLERRRSRHFGVIIVTALN